MNIFFTSKCPIECARFLDDKRIVKMCLETSQMLSTALYLTAPELYTVTEFCNLKTKKIKKAYYLDGQRMPAPTHINHPSNKWMRLTRMNFIWGVQHLQALCKEYTNRYGKIHAHDNLITSYLKYAKGIPWGALTEFVNCAAHDGKGISYKHIKNTTDAYKKYLNDRWGTDVRTPTWYGER